MTTITNDASQQNNYNTDTNSKNSPISGKNKTLKEQVRECQVDWYEETLEEAEEGNPVSMALTGQMLMNGYGVTRNDAKGIDWIKKALESAKGVAEYSHLISGWERQLEVSATTQTS
mmetsp:Transcript_18089/g.33026  ORF Transcript_18089/g.33026 Transcript_18089/m.33026 type:complete len:117 (-) Transcript_18089:46-396(-)|eukprot:CAMPEP_0175041336 /NCGR_PEP_ID=MMETSP0052_2-20121109/1851_1 /TAXON_ID=51329 ORGANISM="Polytomella parva, Strain SAG 63-3" /NCGR_SAMPLE_ID=MMETSP0052_2 /ASSEMBLY_ACC=CAM_ASM_000194 /LENGTH=116 /DNA_ID=CAMNT_0016303825 /DNA_START=140 /DNA_END=490 /DNA_ORIENTATION=+